jgi:hypothetical protein
MDSRPPLDLQVELVYPDNSTVRWDANAPAKDKPTGISFKTQRYTGFADANLALARRIDLDYPDLGLLDGLNLIGHDGSVAYEGWTGSLPRSLRASPEIGLQIAGWMAHASDEPFVECFVDRDLSKWTSPSRSRSLALLIANYSPGSSAQLRDESGNPCVEVGFQDAWVAPFKPAAEAWWLPQAGISIGALYYALASTSSAVNPADSSWHARVALGENDNNTNDVIDVLPAPRSGYLAATGARRAALLQLAYESTPQGTASATYNAQFEKLAVYGDHGLERRGEDPGGFFVSDLMRFIAGKYAPLLDTSGIQDTDFAVRHASFLSDTKPYDSWVTLNAFHRWELAVYEGRKLLYYPVDRNDYDWEVRRSDAGATVALQGEDSEHLCNGVIVRYTDLNTGYATRLSPDDFAELRDDSPENPVNQHGRHKYTSLELSAPMTQEAAIQVGRIYLAEFNEAQAPGTINLTGYVRDRAGHWQQGWKVRAGDRLIISDLPNDRVRIVGETEWNHDAKTLRLAVDSSFKELDAILARMGMELEAANLSLP